MNRLMSQNELNYNTICFFQALPTIKTNFSVIIRREGSKKTIKSHVLLKTTSKEQRFAYRIHSLIAGKESEFNTISQYISSNLNHRTSARHVYHYSTPYLGMIKRYNDKNLVRGNLYSIDIIIFHFKIR